MSSIVFLSLFALFLNGVAPQEVKAPGPRTCKTILAFNPNAPSGVYQIFTPNTSILVRVYCEMGLNGGGYTFIDPQYLPDVTDQDVQAMFTDRSSLLMRVRKTDGTQPYIVLSQLPQYKTIPLKLGVSESSLYKAPVNAPVLGAPYLFFGFLPIANSSNNALQGLQVNGQSLTFNNCDENPNSYVALFANFGEKSSSAYAITSQWAFCDSIFGAALDNPSARVMPEEYYMFTETHWGGCGCYTQTDARLKPQGILSSTIGFR